MIGRDLPRQARSGLGGTESNVAAGSASSLPAGGHGCGQRVQRWNMQQYRGALESGSLFSARCYKRRPGLGHFWATVQVFRRLSCLVSCRIPRTYDQCLKAPVSALLLALVRVCHAQTCQGKVETHRPNLAALSASTISMVTAVEAVQFNEAYLQRHASALRSSLCGARDIPDSLEISNRKRRVNGDRQ